MRTVISLLQAALDMYRRLAAPPDRPPTPGWRLFLQISAGLLSLLSIAAGVFFFFLVFSETEPWARWTTAAFTFGLFGLPTTVVVIVPLFLTVGLRSSRMDIVDWSATVTLIVAYFVQWQLLAWLVYRRSRFTGSASGDDLSKITRP